MIEVLNTTTKSIAFIELDFHVDCLDGFMKIFQDEQIQLHVFTTTKNLKLLQNVSYSKNIHFYEFKGLLKTVFILKYSQIFQKCHLIFIGTIASDYGAYLFLPKKSIIVLRIHNVNKQFAPLQNILLPHSFRALWKFFSYVGRQIIFKQFLIYRVLINKKINYFTFPDSGITDYVKSNNYLPIDKIINPIPLKIYSSANSLNLFDAKILNLTIIGSVDEKRRNYSEVISAIHNIFKFNTSCLIHLTLLGSCQSNYGKWVIQELQKLPCHLFSFTYFNTQVDETKFIEIVTQSQIIISPITPNASVDIFREQYGVTKTTGSILDFIKFGKITLVPHHYNPPKEFTDFIIKYNHSEDLASIILDLINKKKINMLSKKSLDFVKEKYNKQAVLKQTLKTFNNLIH